jgi:Xaa-Pro dipeptidase
MNSPSFDYEARWKRAAALMERDGIDALFLMKPANLAYVTGDGRPCALALLTRALRCVVAVPACDLASVRRASAATDIRSFQNEAEMFHGFRDALAELGLTQATIAIEKNFFDAALYEVFTAHILPQARVVPAAPILSQLRMRKDATEIACLKAAGNVADEGMAAAARALRPGVREIEMAGEAELAMRKAGAEGWASATSPFKVS